MNQLWYDVLFLMVGFLVGLPCGFIALVVKLGIEQEKKSRSRLAPTKRQGTLYTQIIQPRRGTVK